MDSEDSRDAPGDAHSTSSSSSTSSRSRRSSSSDSSKKDPKSPPRSPPSPHSNGPRSPSPESQSRLSHRSTSIGKQPQSPDYLSGAHSDFNSTRSTPDSPRAPKSPPAPKSPSENASNAGSPEPREHYSSETNFAREGPKTPQSPNGSIKSLRGSPSNKSQPISPDSASQVTSPIRNPEPQSPTSNPSPDRASSQSSPPRSPIKKTEWSPKEKWRRHTKAEQKMVSAPRNRSRSESSQSSRSSSYNKRTSSKDPAMEAISDGEMESDQDDSKSRSKSITSDKPEKDHNISHEDLSDVSDIDSDGPDDIEKESKNRSKSPPSEKKNQAVNGKDGESTQQSPKSDGVKEVHKLEKVPQEKISTEDGEEQLDFEAEEGECIEPKAKDQSNGDVDVQIAVDKLEAGRRSRGSSLEEGEVSDEGERRPEESEPRPVCRFFSRGVCTWGVSCRFLHPGVTDKGNYNMFEVIRGVPPAGPYPPPRDTAPPESAWERGLRTAKEMLRIANKRKEQDMDFEEKKLHLSVGGIVHDPDAELAYAAAAVGASPPRDIPPVHRDPEMYRPHGVMYRGGRFPRPPMDERERYHERERGYERERIYERPPYFEEHMAAPEEIPYHKRRVRSSREVIVQRAEVERREGREGRESRETRGREGRGGDEWADPWMRAEPAARRRRPPSSEDSYSSSSSRSSGSPGARRKRRASSSSRQRLSPSVIVRERRLATARATAMNPPAPRRRAPSPGAARQLAVNPPPPPHRHKDEIDPYGRNKLSSRSRNRKKYSRSSSSGSESSTSTSESESESRSSSSSGSSGARRARHARLLNAAARPRISAKANSGLAAAVSTVTNKKESSIEKEILSKKRSATSPVRGEGPAKKSVSRREELLKQLKAVEDAIARKRSKI